LQNGVIFRLHLHIHVGDFCILHITFKFDACSALAAKKCVAVVDRWFRQWLHCRWSAHV